MIATRPRFAPSDLHHHTAVEGPSNEDTHLMPRCASQRLSLYEPFSGEMAVCACFCVASSSILGMHNLSLCVGGRTCDRDIPPLIHCICRWPCEGCSKSSVIEPQAITRSHSRRPPYPLSSMLLSSSSYLLFLFPAGSLLGIHIPSPIKGNRDRVNPTSSTLHSMMDSVSLLFWRSS